MRPAGRQAGARRRAVWRRRRWSRSGLRGGFSPPGPFFRLPLRFLRYYLLLLADRGSLFRLLAFFGLRLCFLRHGALREFQSTAKLTSFRAQVELPIHLCVPKTSSV